MTSDGSDFDLIGDAEAWFGLRFKINDISGIDLPDDLDAIFEALRERCPKRPIGRLYGSTREGIAACRYHSSNVADLEQSVLSCIRGQIRGRTRLASAGMTFPGIQKITAEYNAFEFGTRRTLDYMAKGIAAFLGRDVNSVRSIYKLEKTLSPRTASEQAVCESWRLGLDSLADMLEPVEGQTDTTRNRIAHDEPVDGGQVCISRRSMNMASPDYNLIEVRLIGGGERLFPWNGPGIELAPRLDNIVCVQTLKPVLEDRLARLERMTRLTFEALTVCAATDPA